MTDPILDNIARAKANDAAKKLSMKLGQLSRFVENKLKNVFAVTGSKSQDTDRPLFALLIFADGNLQYTSNTDRETTKRMMATLVQRWDERGMHIPLHEKTDEELAKEREEPL